MPWGARWPGGWLLAAGVLHLGDRVARGQVRVAALCGVGAGHGVQPGTEQREHGYSASHAAAHSVITLEDGTAAACVHR